MNIKIPNKRTSKRHPKNINKYAGRWVAFLDDVIIESNVKLKNLVCLLDKKNLRHKTSVFLVPPKNEGPYVLFL